MQKKTILIVEDDLDIRQGIAEFLKDIGHQVFTAENGSLALQQLRSSPKPDLILLDLFMPVMNGADFVRALRYQEQTSDIPVVLVSAAPPNGELARSIEPLTQGFLKKPVSLESLMNAINSHAA